MMQAQDDMSTTENVGETPRQPVKMCKEMLNAICNSVSILANPDHQQDEKDEEHEEDT